VAGIWNMVERDMQLKMKLKLSLLFSPTKFSTNKIFPTSAKKKKKKR
jgi:hypothetical protein